MKKLILAFFLLLVANSGNLYAIERSNQNIPGYIQCDKDQIIRGAPTNNSEFPNCAVKLYGGYYGSSYYINTGIYERMTGQVFPSNAVCEWSIVGTGRCYVYGNGTLCNISIYGMGSYRLVCDIYVNGQRVDAVYRYIDVR